MYLAVLWAKTEGESVTGLSDRLENNPELAEAFGFHSDDIPHGDTFARAWRNRFEDLQDSIETTAKTIDEIATKRGSPIGGHTGLDPDETNGTSKTHGTAPPSEKDERSDGPDGGRHLPRARHSSARKRDLRRRGYAGTPHGNGGFTTKLQMTGPT